ncbi:unnamed protein product [Angiostrongylus costaricensis]|uniref:Myotubularin phosphatase domain-containing protein n=1 Tax=Angiostrongylus costaricensis TaxID=334426 RepID=A0A0R3PY94_ANGCS|nr:unnamed protein product [Angiostrongylus costaricensis]
MFRLVKNVLTLTQKMSIELFQGFKFSSQFDYVSDDIEECGTNSKMDKMLRLTVTSLHNTLRGLLVNRTQKNGNGSRARNFPSAGDMSLMEYNCKLEESAFNISQMCQNQTVPNFSFVGSNNATYFLSRATFDHNKWDYFRDDISDYFRIIRFMMEWWNTSLEYGPLVNLTPTASDSGIIPFLQVVCDNALLRFIERRRVGRTIFCTIVHQFLNIGAMRWRTLTRRNWDAHTTYAIRPIHTTLRLSCYLFVDTEIRIFVSTKQSTRKEHRAARAITAAWVALFVTRLQQNMILKDEE